jgi:hypothetical protein
MRTWPAQLQTAEAIELVRGAKGLVKQSEEIRPTAISGGGIEGRMIGNGEAVAGRIDLVLVFDAGLAERAVEVIFLLLRKRVIVHGAGDIDAAPDVLAKMVGTVRLVGCEIAAVE